MPPKRRRSSSHDRIVPAKRTRTVAPNDHFSVLSSELLIRIFHHLPIEVLLQCQLVSHRFYTLASDSQIWKSLYYSRFVLPRALRIPGIRNAPPSEYDDALKFSSRRCRWLNDGTLVNRKDGGKTDWKSQYRLRHNWSIGACDVQEIRVRDRKQESGMLVKLAEGCVVTVDREDGLRAWDLKGKHLIARSGLEGTSVPTCVAVQENTAGYEGLGIAVGFEDGSWGTWRLDIKRRIFRKDYRHPSSSNGLLSAIAYANSYVLTITDSQLLSLYTFAPAPLLEQERDETATKPAETVDEEFLEAELIDPDADDSSKSSMLGPDAKPAPRLLASLKSHTCWPPLSLSIRATPATIIASIAYSLPTYFSGYTIGLQELHLSPETGTLISSRLTSALPQGFSSILTSPTSSSPSSGASSPMRPHRRSGVAGGTATSPTSLSYAHPYILATHPDNTLSLYLCTSTSSVLLLSKGTRLWGHTSSVSSAEITSRGKAVSVSTRGDELRVWSLEGGFSSTSRWGLKKSKEQPGDRSVQIRHPPLHLSSPITPSKGQEAGIALEREDQETIVAKVNQQRDEENVLARKHWVGFDDEVVIVLKEDVSGTQTLVVYDFA